MKKRTKLLCLALASSSMLLAFSISKSTHETYASGTSFDGSDLYIVADSLYTDCDNPSGIGFRYRIHSDSMNLFNAYGDGDSFGETVFAGNHRASNNGICDNEGHNFADYFYINGVSYAEISENNKRGITNYNGQGIDPGIGAEYAPVSLVYCSTYLSVQIMGDYLKDTSHTPMDVNIVIKKGCPFLLSDKSLYTLSRNITVNVACNGEKYYFADYDEKGNNLFVRDIESNRVSSLGSNGYYMQLWFNKTLGSGVKGTFVLDHNLNFAANVLFNGESLQSIWMNTDDSSWSYADGINPAGSSDPNNSFSKPIYLLCDANNSSCMFLTKRLIQLLMTV